jgi:hypothetical protein
MRPSIDGRTLPTTCVSHMVTEPLPPHPSLIENSCSPTMASSSSSTTIPSAFSVLVSEKLTKSNYLLWHTQVMPAIRAAELEGFLTSDEKAPTKTVTSKDDKGQDVVLHNPAYSQWVARDQVVLGYILSSLSRETLVLVATCICAADVWSELSKFYSSQV